MSIYGEIEASLGKVRLQDDGIITGEAIFNDDFSAFQGHFPDKPIVPGVCLIDAVKIMIEKVLKKKLEMSEILSLKFSNAVSPEELIELSISIKERDQRLIATSNVSRGGEKISVSKVEFREIL